MFDFEKFPVYIRTETFISKLQSVLENKRVNFRIKDQLYRASSSILLNLAEGAAKYSQKDKKNYYLICRGSIQETVAILRIIKLEGKISFELYSELYNILTDVSKMVSGLVKRMES